MDYLAVDGDALSRKDSDLFSDSDLLNRDVHLHTVADDSSSLRSQTH